MRREQLCEVFIETDEKQQVTLSSLLWYILVWEQRTFGVTETLPLVLFPVRQGGIFDIFDTRCFVNTMNLGQLFIKAPSSLVLAKPHCSVSAVRAWLLDAGLEQVGKWSLNQPETTR